MQLKATRKSARGVRKGAPAPTYAAFKRELDQLTQARNSICKNTRYNKTAEALEKSGLPYRLVQDFRDSTGAPVRGYRYWFTSDWDGPATLYIQETAAGRAQYRTPRAAMDALEHVLNERAHEAHRREFYARLGETGKRKGRR